MRAASVRGGGARAAHQAAGTSACYITVDDVDSLWAEVQKAGVRVTRPIENSGYRMRDFNIVDPDGNVLGFGQPTGAL